MPICSIQNSPPASFKHLIKYQKTRVTDELESLFDFLWLQHQRTNLERYAGPEQGGGIHSCTLLAIGILIALQNRTNLQLPTYVLKADLLQGYDLAWKDAVALHCKLAGVTGSFWLTLQASLLQDVCQVRLGPLIGNLLHVVDAGLAQGGRRAVHLFSALTRSLLDEVQRVAIGAAIGPNPLMVQAFVRCADRFSHEHPSVPKRNVLESFINNCSGCTLEVEFAAAVPTGTSATDLMHCLDILCPHSLLMVQYVDDLFAFQSTCSGLRRVCKGMNTLTHCWKHKFAGGRKGASVMTLGAPIPDAEQLETFDDKKPQVVSSLNILGARIDADLSLEDLVNHGVARYISESAALITTMTDLGLGIPHQVAQLNIRVKAAAFFNIELAASATMGWPQLARKLNAAQYTVLKRLLGADAVSFGPGGHHRVMMALGVSFRLSIQVAVQIAIARDCASCSRVRTCPRASAEGLVTVLPTRPTASV